MPTVLEHIQRDLQLGFYGNYIVRERRQGYLLLEQGSRLYLVKDPTTPAVDSLVDEHKRFLKAAARAANRQYHEDGDELDMGRI